MNLKEARFKSGLTQYGVMKLTGIHQSRLSLIENEYASVSEKERLLIARVLKVAPEDIKWPDIKNEFSNN